MKKGGDGIREKNKNNDFVGKKIETHKIVGLGAIRFWVDSKLFDAVRDNPLRGSQKPGGLGHISSGVLEGVDNQLFLIILNCSFKGKERDRTGLFSGLKSGGEMVAVNDPIRAEENGSFYRILELPHVARPMVLHEHVDRWS